MIDSCIFRDLLLYGLVKKWLLPEIAMRPFCRNKLKSILIFGSRTLMIRLKSYHKYKEWCHQHSLQNLDYNSNKINAINIKNKRGPKIEPYGTPNNIFKHSLKVDPILVFGFQFLRYAETKAIDFISKP